MWAECWDGWDGCSGAAGTAVTAGVARTAGAAGRARRAGAARRGTVTTATEWQTEGLAEQLTVKAALAHVTWRCIGGEEFLEPVRLQEHDQQRPRVDLPNRVPLGFYVGPRRHLKRGPQIFSKSDDWKCWLPNALNSGWVLPLPAIEQDVLPSAEVGSCPFPIMAVSPIPPSALLDRHHSPAYHICMDKGIKKGSALEELLSTTEAAQLLGVHPVAVQQMIKTGRLVGRKVARNWIIPREALLEFAKTYVKGPGRRKPLPKKGSQA